MNSYQYIRNKCICQKSVLLTLHFSLVKNKQPMTNLFHSSCKISECLREMAIKNDKNKFYVIMKIKVVFTVVDKVVY